MKIDKKKSLSIAFGIVLASTLLGCESNQENIDSALVYFNNDKAIIITTDRFQVHGSTIIVDNHNIYIGTDNTVIFREHEDNYNDALIFASEISDEVYDYKDLMDGNPTNLKLNTKTL